jgi:hypothetical protein
MPAWLTWTIAIVVGWTLLAFAVGLLVGHIFGRVGAGDATLAQIAEEAEHLDWSVTPLARATPKEAEEMLDPSPGSRTGRVP